jgi:ribosomal protein S16
MLGAGLVAAQERGASCSRMSTTADPGFNLDYCNYRMGERAIDERIIERLGLFDPSNDGQSTRYSVSLDLENEDSDWSFEVTVTMEF